MTHSDRTPVKLRFPAQEAWHDIVRDHKLTDAQAASLHDVLLQTLEEIGRYGEKLSKQPRREDVVAGRKRLEKLFRELRAEYECGLMESVLPDDALGFLGESVTFSTVGAASGKNHFPKSVQIEIDEMRAKGDRITLAHLEEFSRSKRESAGLQHGPIILKHLIDGIHKPLVRAVELDRLYKGGRKPDAIRRHLIRRLAEAAPDILGKAAPVSTMGKFADLCNAVLVACGLEDTGIAKAIPAVVSKLRAENAKWA